MFCVLCVWGFAVVERLSPNGRGALGYGETGRRLDGQTAHIPLLHNTVLPYCYINTRSIPFV